MKLAQVDSGIIPDNICDISLGREHTAFSTSAGTCYTIGRNLNGQLGLGDNVSRLRPVELHLPLSPKDDEKVKVVCTAYSTMFYIAPRQWKHPIQKALFNCCRFEKLVDLCIVVA
jgi:hypothetical protein